ncbi:MAG: VTT domain-containing protein [Acidobacteriota bacterium]|nr:VTT domain-containing protein [Acidobacteriota bacterium]
MSRRALFKLAALALLAAVLVAVWFSPLREHLSREHIRATAAHLRTLWYAPIVFILAYTVGCVVAIPASLFVIAAGFIWGWLPGFAYAMIGGTSGAVVSYFAGRFIGEGLLDRFGRAGKMVRKQVDHAGFRAMLIIRSIPGIPFAAVNYGAGVANVPFRAYFFSTIVAIAPSKLLFTYCADALLNGSMTEQDAFKRLAIVCGLMLTMIAVTTLVKRMGGSRAPEIREELD